MCPLNSFVLSYVQLMPRAVYLNCHLLVFPIKMSMVQIPTPNQTIRKKNSYVATHRGLVTISPWNDAQKSRTYIICLCLCTSHILNSLFKVNFLGWVQEFFPNAYFRLLEHSSTVQKILMRILHMLRDLPCFWDMPGGTSCGQSALAYLACHANLKENVFF